MATYEELLKEYKKLAKKADQRLVRIENEYINKTNYSGMVKYAYSRAIKDLSHYEDFYEDTKPRFNRNIPNTYMGLQRKMNDVKRFLESPTSSVADLKKIYKKRAETVNKEYGTEFTWEELANFYASEDAKKLSEEYGSKTLIRSLGIINRKLKPEDIEAAINNNIKLSDDEVEDEIAKKLLALGYRKENLFEGK